MLSPPLNFIEISRIKKIYFSSLPFLVQWLKYWVIWNKLNSIQFDLDVQISNFSLPKIIFPQFYCTTVKCHGVAAVVDFCVS